MTMSEYHQHLDMIECRIDDGSFRHLPAGRILIRILKGVGTDGRTLLSINIAEADHDVDDPSTEVLLELPEARRLLKALSDSLEKA
jgi:hypothetical protein